MGKLKKMLKGRSPEDSNKKVASTNPLLDDTTTASSEKGMSTATTVASANNKHSRNGRIVHPTSNDVLFGRGKPFQSHEGNVFLHKLVKLHKDRYVNSRRYDKLAIAEEIVICVKEGSKGMPGRFLKRAEDDGEDYWVEVTNEVAREKVSHALRGKARNKSTTFVGAGATVSRTTAIKDAVTMKKKSSKNGGAKKTCIKIAKSGTASSSISQQPLPKNAFAMELNAFQANNNNNNERLRLEQQQTPSSLQAHRSLFPSGLPGSMGGSNGGGGIPSFLLQSLGNGGGGGGGGSGGGGRSGGGGGGGGMAIPNSNTGGGNGNGSSMLPGNLELLAQKLAGVSASNNGSMGVQLNQQPNTNKKNSMPQIGGGFNLNQLQQQGASQMIVINNLNLNQLQNLSQVGGMNSNNSNNNQQQQCNMPQLGGVNINQLQQLGMNPNLLFPNGIKSGTERVSGLATTGSSQGVGTQNIQQGATQMDNNSNGNVQPNISLALAQIRANNMIGNKLGVGGRGPSNNSSVGKDAITNNDNLLLQLQLQQLQQQQQQQQQQGGSASISQQLNNNNNILAQLQMQQLQQQQGGGNSAFQQPQNSNNLLLAQLQMQQLQQQQVRGGGGNSVSQQQQNNSNFLLAQLQMQQRQGGGEGSSISQQQQNNDNRLLAQLRMQQLQQQQRGGGGGNSVSEQQNDNMFLLAQLKQQSGSGIKSASQ